MTKAFDVVYELIHKFSKMNVSDKFLMQLDQLVQLLEKTYFYSLTCGIVGCESNITQSFIEKLFWIINAIATDECLSYIKQSIDDYLSFT